MLTLSEYIALEYPEVDKWLDGRKQNMTKYGAATVRYISAVDTKYRALLDEARKAYDTYCSECGKESRNPYAYRGLSRSDFI